MLWRREQIRTGLRNVWTTPVYKYRLRSMAGSAETFLLHQKRGPCAPRFGRRTVQILTRGLDHAIS